MSEQGQEQAVWNRATPDGEWDGRVCAWCDLSPVEIGQPWTWRPEPEPLILVGGEWLHEDCASIAAKEVTPAPERTPLEALPGWVWDLNEAQWEDGFHHLRRFVEREGHSRVPQKHREEGYPLGVWVTAQRSFRSRGELSEARMAMLEALPGWVWHAKDVLWEEGFAHLERFVEQEGHTLIPQQYRDDEGFRLGAWVANQRVRARSKQGPAAEQHVQRLEAVPGWVWDQVEARWEEAFARLEAFVGREGHSLPPSNYGDKHDFRLGKWVEIQRGRRRRGVLPSERALRLEALPGWVWDAKDAGEVWEENFARLLGFVEREGHSRVPYAYQDADRYRLGVWVEKQRRSRNQGQLPEERAQRLEGLPAWTWDAREAAWEDAYARLLRFAKSHGHARVPPSYRDQAKYRLGGWVTSQRAYRRRGKLSGERARRLESIAGEASRIDTWLGVGSTRRAVGGWVRPTAAVRRP